MQHAKIDNTSAQPHEDRNASTLIPVTSSNVAAVGYDDRSRRLIVQFRPKVGATPSEGAVYEYEDVPITEFAHLIATDLAGGSVGGEFDARIKRGGYPYKRLPKPP